MKEKIFITSQLMGGLGNQMFQIAKALAVGIENGIDVKFRREAFIPLEGRQPSNYAENIFRHITFEDFVDDLPIFRETSWAYRENNLTVTSSVKFLGYWQSSKNFGAGANDIRRRFSPTDGFIAKIRNRYADILEKDSVSIHVRRGDYLRLSAIHPVIDKSYIDSAIDCIGKTSRIFVFSNDMKWCRENLDYAGAIFVDGLEDYEELWAMSMCDHNILSNSSFSWWGAFLNAGPNRKVCAPSLWFGPKGESHFEDIYEPDWQRIAVKFNEGRLVAV
jgi:hypothetical protein